MRKTEISRKTNETDIRLSLCLEGKGTSEIQTDCGFLNHMLTLFASHGRFDIALSCKGDTQVDYHHTAEDIGIVLGQGFKNALGDKKGIVRYGDTALPMDEALILTAVDISGRGFLGYGLSGLTEKVGDFDTELVKEFFLAFVRESGITLHINRLSGENTHHIIEGAFKSAARSLRKAVEIDPAFANEIPSTKGAL